MVRKQLLLICLRIRADICAWSINAITRVSAKIRLRISVCILWRRRSTECKPGLSRSSLNLDIIPGTISCSVFRIKTYDGGDDDARSSICDCLDGDVDDDDNDDDYDDGDYKGGSKVIYVQHAEYFIRPPCSHKRRLIDIYTTIGALAVFKC